MHEALGLINQGSAFRQSPGLAPWVIDIPDDQFAFLSTELIFPFPSTQFLPPFSSYPGS